MHSRHPSEGASKPSQASAHGLEWTQQSRASASVAHSSSSPQSDISPQPIGSQHNMQPSQSTSSRESIIPSQASSQTHLCSSWCPSSLCSLSPSPFSRAKTLLKDLAMIGVNLVAPNIPSSSMHSRHPSEGASKPSQASAHGLEWTQQSRASASEAHSSSSPQSDISPQPIGSQ